MPAVAHRHNKPAIHHTNMVPQHPDLLPISFSSYTIDYSSFAPYMHVAYASDSGAGRHSIFLPPYYSSYSQLLISTSPIQTQSSIFFAET